MTIGSDGVARPKPSKKPFIVFLLAVFGLPYLMGKLIKALARSQAEKDKALAQQQGTGAMMPYDPNNNDALLERNIDPSKLDFCRLLYDFPPLDALHNGTFDANMDLSVKKGDLVAVLDKSDPAMGPQNVEVEADWWRCRSRDGRMGYLPKVYLETVQRRATAQIGDGSGDGSRANSLPGSVGGGRAQTLTSEAGGGGGRAQTLTSERAASLTSVVGGGGDKGAAAASVGLDQGEKDKGKLGEFQKAWANER